MSNNKQSSSKTGSAAASKQNSLSGGPSAQLSTHGNSGSQLPVLGPGRASFVYDAVGPPLDELVLTPGSSTTGAAAGGSLGRRSNSGQPPLPPTAKQLQQQQQNNRQRLSPDVLEQHASHTAGSGGSSGGAPPGESSSGSYVKRIRASMDSVGSKASSARSGTGRSTRSSFALEASPVESGQEDLQIDAYGRPSFAAFETSLKGKGTVPQPVLQSSRPALCHSRSARTLLRCLLSTTLP
jgi:hypothetical protein